MFFDLVVQDLNIYKANRGKPRTYDFKMDIVSENNNNIFIDSISNKSN